MSFRCHRPSGLFRVTVIQNAADKKESETGGLSDAVEAGMVSSGLHVMRLSDFSQWNLIFSGATMTVTVIDRIIITQPLSESAVKVMGEKNMK